uniref:Uncharacterized protein n=1 Tax=Ananas comosus var. bracteatus TaxID=296719 RepID=A0A6V7NX25_ANACO|nr:unnamed protein product [Ananas comosus var. bracteatus]
MNSHQGTSLFQETGGTAVPALYQFVPDSRELLFPGTKHAQQQLQYSDILLLLLVPGHHHLPVQVHPALRLQEPPPDRRPEAGEAALGQPQVAAGVLPQDPQLGRPAEGRIAAEAEVAAFRAQLLETLIVAPPKDQDQEPEPAGVIRDKLLFLQELLYAKCISAEDYHSSKRPLLQRLAVQGVEIDCRDVIVGALTANSDEEWTDIDLKDKEEPSVAANKSKHRTPPIKAFFTKVNATTTTKGKGNKDTADSTRGGDHNLMHKGTILMPESSPLVPVKPEKGKRKPFGTLFRKEQGDGNENKNPNLEPEEKGGPQSRFGDNIKKELSRIQSELSATNPNLNFSAWCDRYGEIVLDVVKKEFKEHVGEMESLRNTAAKEKRNGVAENWVAFEDNEENFHPNLFSQSQPLLNRRMVNDNNNNPFYDG